MESSLNQWDGLSCLFWDRWEHLGFQSSPTSRRVPLSVGSSWIWKYREALDRLSDLNRVCILENHYVQSLLEPHGSHLTIRFLYFNSFKISQFLLLNYSNAMKYFLHSNLQAKSNRFWKPKMRLNFSKTFDFWKSVPTGFRFLAPHGSQHHSFHYFNPVTISTIISLFSFFQNLNH
jgi:hypothetical protein